MGLQEARAALEQLRLACASLEPYDGLQDGRHRVGRQKLLRMAADALGGSSLGGSLLEDTCGVRNKTAMRIISRYEGIRTLAGPTGALDRKSREWSINALSLILEDGSRNALAALGCRVGDSLFKSITDFIRSGGFIYETPASNYAGRKRSCASQPVAQEWISLSHATTRTNASGEELRVIPGGTARAVQTIMEKHKCSRTTAYSYRPETVSAAKKKSDLCTHCEALRRVRLSIIAHAQDLGLSIETPGAHEGQKEVAANGDAAAEFCANSMVAGPDVSISLKRYEILKWHEKFAKVAHEKLILEQEKGPCIVFDFAANIVTKYG